MFRVPGSRKPGFQAISLFNFTIFFVFALRQADDMKLVENSEIEELAARLVFPENMELLKNV